MVPIWVVIAAAVIALVLGCLAGVLFMNGKKKQAYDAGVEAGIEQRKQQAEAAIGSAEKEASRILSDAKKEAESKKKSALVEAKD